MSNRVTFAVPGRSARISGRQRKILGERGLFRRSAAVVTALFSLLAGSLAGPIALDTVSPAYASATSFMVNNEKLRFGGDGHNSTSYTFVHSIANSGMPQQPFYKNAAGNWRKLTYSNIPLSMTLGSGAGGNTNWSGATIPSSGAYDSHMGINSLTGLTIDASGMTARSPSQAVPYGYGTLVVSGTVDLNGASVRVRHQYELGQNDSFVKATTTITNLSASPIANGYVWIGTRDDWVGDSDGPTKTRGNIVDGAFSPIANKATASNAIEIKTGSEGVLFYSTTPNTATAINSCCSFINAYGQNPTTSEPSLSGDGSYAISLPLGNLAAGASGEIVWFYAAGAIADLAQIVSSVAAAAAPAVPTAVPGDGSSTVTWLAPSSDDPITGYRIQVTKDGVVQSPDVDVPATPLSATLGDLVNGSTYTFKVAALTGDAPTYTAGTFSGSSLAVIPGAPTAPAISSVTAGNQRLTVAFTAPEHTGGFPISDYEYSTNNGSTW